MQSVEKFIEQTKMIKPGDVIGVGCSGGSDSMALLSFLAQNQEKYDIEVVAIHVDHSIRENSSDDADFVRAKAREMGVRFYKFRIDAPKIAKDKGISLEWAAREGRYGVFDALLKKGLVDKIALAHQKSDQAETILMHLFRGAGMSGAKGMEGVRDGVYIRPMLNTSKQEIYDWLSENRIDYVDDETNADNTYNRNFVRNVLMREVVKRWPSAVDAITSFAKSIAEDDEFINSMAHIDAVMFEDKVARVPLSYFLYQSPIANRILFKVFKRIGITRDIERKHIEAIKELATKGENGKRIYLPFEAIAIREYDYLTIYNRHTEEVTFSQPFKCGEFEVPSFGKVIVKRVKDFTPKEGVLYLDYRKVPKTASWRFREDGDVFEKFGGGKKKLKSFLIDKKIPQRKRNFLPVLADGNEIYAIAGVEISEKVKVEDVPTAYMIEVKNG